MASESIRGRLAAGKALREQAPRTALAAWSGPADSRDPLAILDRCNQGRMPELVPLRSGRMLHSPFTFLRGLPALMAHDLSAVPVTGLRVQACGDCHLTNFGLFATPERNLVFDINDFDETLPAPWEWDVLRLAVSFVVAGRTQGICDQDLHQVSTACVRSYRRHMRAFAEMSPLDVWYSRVSAEDLIELAPDGKSRKRRERMAEKARSRGGESLFPKIITQEDGEHRFKEQPPVMTRVTDERWLDEVRTGIEAYRQTLSDDRRFVFDRYRAEDFALRVVGIGSVATRCFVALLFCDDQNPLLLQVKEARPSVLEPHAGKSTYGNQGERVVAGQRLIQFASDMFLGWLRISSGHDFYVRQLRDMKYSLPIESFNAEQLGHYAELCGWVLARAHARSGDAAKIAGFLGKGDQFDQATAKFAATYADQVERDHEVLLNAAKAGRVEALREEPE